MLCLVDFSSSGHDLAAFFVSLLNFFNLPYFITLENFGVGYGVLCVTASDFDHLIALC